MPTNAPRFKPRVLSTPVQHDRPSARVRGYDRAWERIRLVVLKAEPLCRDPFGVHRAANRVEPATLVDHIRPLAAGGTHDLDNLQPLCVACHNRKTNSIDGGYGNPRK